MMNQSLYQLTLEMLLQKGCPQALAKKAAAIIATDDIRQPNPKQQAIIEPVQAHRSLHPGILRSRLFLVLKTSNALLAKPGNTSSNNPYWG